MSNFKTTDLSGGMIDVNVNIAPLNTVSVLLNMDCDVEIGSAVSRLGRATINAQIIDNKTVLGLHQHIDADTASNNKLFAVVSDGTNNDIYIATTAVKSLEDDTKDLKTRFLTFNGATLRLNGTDGEKSYTSAGWITTGGAFDLANFPGANKNKYPIEFLDRVYAAGDTAEPTRLYYSGVSDGATVSWTVGNGYVDIEPEDGGGPITGLGKVPGYVLVFKERSLHRWNFTSAFPESLINIGTPSHESIVMGGGLCAFYSNSNENEKGFYITNGGRPQPISQDNNRPIKKWVDAIASSSDANVAGWATNRGFAWSVGDLTVDGEIYSNVVLRYNRLLNQWSMRTYPTEFRVFAQYLVSGVNTIVGGDDDGTVYRVDNAGVYTDAVAATTRPIPWKVRQHHMTYGTNFEKTINEKAVVRGKNLESMRVNLYVDEILDPIPQKRGIWKKILSVFKVGDTVKGTTISVEVGGESTGARSYIREIELPNIVVSNKYD